MILNYKLKKKLIFHMPRDVWVEPTNYCNLRCIMCPQGIDEVGEKGFMDLNLFKSIIDQCASFQPTIHLFMGGESLLHKDILTMIEYVKNKGLSSVLATNAILLDSSLSLKLMNSGIDYLVFSFDGYDETSYNNIRIGGDFSKTLGNIIGFLRLKKEMRKEKPKITLYSLALAPEKILKEEMREYKKFHENFSNLPVDNFIVGEAEAWAGKFYGTTKFKVRKPGPHFIPCPRLWKDMAIRWDGKVVPCCADLKGDLILGEVDKTRLEEIWNGERLVSLRGLMVEGRHQEIALCRNCNEPYPSSNMMKWGLPYDYIPGPILKILRI
ncbi:MAG: radical SAM/SPASM domain-containing protein [bacterium]